MYVPKIYYDFDTSANLEVKIKEIWYRTTPNDFRSFNGFRRINGFNYDGPIYYKDTNDLIPINKMQPLINYPPNYKPVGINYNNVRRKY